MGKPVDQIEKSRTYKWSIKLFEQRSLCLLEWGTDAPFRAQQGRVCLYEGVFPSEPAASPSWTWDDQPQPFNTNRPWGTGWTAARIAERPSNGPYVYAAQTPVSTLTGGPVTDERSYTWRLRLYNTGGSGPQGNRCAIDWSTDAPFRAHQGKICLYEGSFPANPDSSAAAWTWDDAPKPLVTDKHWGPGWCAAIIAQRSAGGPYVYVVQTDITTE